MALPLTLSGVYFFITPRGPFCSSAGNVYFFSRNQLDTTQLQVFKATDPTTSFSVIATETTAAACQEFDAVQIGDILHVAVIEGSLTNDLLRYRTFDMSTDAFVISEIVQSGFNPSQSTTDDAYGCSIAIRSGGQPAIIYNGAQVANMGNSYARIVGSYRTGVNTWVSNVALDAGGAVNGLYGYALTGSSDRVHFFWNMNSANITTSRTLRADNSLSTAITNSSGGQFRAGLQGSMHHIGVSYDDAGTQRVLIASRGSSGNFYIVTHRFDSSDSPTFTNAVGIGDNSNVDDPVRVLYDPNGDLHFLYIGDVTGVGDVLLRTSSDDGADAPAGDISLYVGSIAADIANLCRPGDVYVRGGNYVIGYILNDGGVMKYNEHILRAVPAAATSLVFNPAPFQPMIVR
jgi:hypothetical protein